MTHHQKISPTAMAGLVVALGVVLAWMNADLFLHGLLQRKESVRVGEALLQNVEVRIPASWSTSDERRLLAVRWAEVEAVHCARWVYVYSNTDGDSDKKNDDCCNRAMWSFVHGPGLSQEEMQERFEVVRELGACSVPRDVLMGRYP